MSVYNQSEYKEFESYINNLIESVSNGLILTLPGMGLSYFLKSYLKKTSKKIDYYSSVPDKLSSEINVIENDSTNISFLDDLDSLLKRQLDVKVILCLNQPQMTETEKYKNSYFSHHTYSAHYLKLVRYESCFDICREVNPKLKETEIKKIYGLSGGFRKLIKFLCLNADRFTGISKADVVKSDELKTILQPTVNSVSKCSTEMITKLGIDKDNLIFDLKPNLEVDIEIKDDLSFWEHGKKNTNKLTVFEKEVLEYLLNNDLFISKEGVSDIKWGEGKYDNYSDQAINKAMRRLNKKLMFHKIETIIKTGFRLKIKNDD